MDFKVLFHDPDHLTDKELVTLTKKIRVAQSLPVTTSAFLALSMYLFDVKMIRRHHDWKRVIAAGALGYALGCYGSERNTLPIQTRKFDEDIINAYEQRYAESVLNHTGFGSNYIGAKDFADVGGVKKPY